MEKCWKIYLRFSYCYNCCRVASLAKVKVGQRRNFRCDINNFYCDVVFDKSTKYQKL